MKNFLKFVCQDFIYNFVYYIPNINRPTVIDTIRMISFEKVGDVYPIYFF